MVGEEGKEEDVNVIFSLISTTSSSDAHGYGDPCGFTDTGVTGAGVGHQIFTHDDPIPIWAGDGLCLDHIKVTCQCSQHTTSAMDGCNNIPKGCG